jgi:acyl CoA:acetate/3-ketoacid CoA transferase alpha subunit
MARSKLISLPEAIRRFTRDGMQYASGAALPVGSDAIIFGRELLRQGRKDLHAIFHCNSQQLNLLAAAGAVTKAECGFAALEVYGFANGVQAALRFGLINEAVPASALVAHTKAFARELAAKSPLTLAIGKEAFCRQAELPFAEPTPMQARS